MSRALRWGGAHRLKFITTTVLGVIVLATASLAGVAVAKSVTTLGTAKVKVAGATKTIVVNSNGGTVYALRGETDSHLLCINSSCFKAWVPVKVASAKSKVTKAPGITGIVRIFRRVRGGFYQLTLAGHPLYTFAGDKGKKGSAKGAGIRSFGGTWNVVTAG